MTPGAADPPLGTFLVTLRRSRLVDPADLDRLAARHDGSARDLTDTLLRNGTLTHYQVDKLLNGRWQGLVLGPYSVLAPLGRGGMGTVVYLARDRRQSEALGDSELAALKLLPNRQAARDPKALARCLREMDLGRRVAHPNVVRTFAAGETDDVHYLAMEYVSGRTLRQVVIAGGPLAVGDAARVGADVAAGLAHIHARGMIHRDVNPGNIMVRSDGRGVLLDLGLAYAPGEPLPADPTIVGGRGYAVGTMDYLAPEQARDASAVGPAADLYGLGCTLAFALNGSVPFPAATTKEKIQRHRDDPPPALAHVPPDFARIVHSLMAKEQHARPATAAEARDLLLKWATAQAPRSLVDAVTLADAPGEDAGLWAAAPGEDIPLEEIPEEEVGVLEEIPEEVLELPPEEPRRAGCAGAALLLVAVGVWAVL